MQSSPKHVSHICFALYCNFLCFPELHTATASGRELVAFNQRWVFVRGCRQGSRPVSEQCAVCIMMASPFTRNIQRAIVGLHCWWENGYLRLVNNGFLLFWAKEWIQPEALCFASTDEQVFITEVSKKKQEKFVLYKFAHSWTPEVEAGRLWQHSDFSLSITSRFKLTLISWNISTPTRWIGTKIMFIWWGLAVRVIPWLFQHHDKIDICAILRNVLTATFSSALCSYICLSW